MFVRSPKNACILALKRTNVCNLQSLVPEGSSGEISFELAQELEAHVLVHLNAKHEIRLRAGARVRVQGLKTAHTLNGKEGQLLFFVDAGGRWAVRIIGGEDVRIKPANLLLEPLDIYQRLGDSSDPMLSILGSCSIADLTAFSMASSASRHTVLEHLQLGIHREWSKPMPPSNWPEIRRKNSIDRSNFKLEIIYESPMGRGERCGVPMPTDAFLNFMDLLFAARVHEFDIPSVTRLVTALCDTHTFDSVSLEVHDALSGYAYHDAYILPAARVAGELVAHNWTLQWKDRIDDIATLIFAVAERMGDAYKEAVAAVAKRRSREPEPVYSTTVAAAALREFLMHCSHLGWPPFPYSSMPCLRVELPMLNARDELLATMFRRFSSSNEKCTFLFEYMFGPGECFTTYEVIKNDLLFFCEEYLTPDEFLEVIQHMLRLEMFPDGTLISPDMGGQPFTHRLVDAWTDERLREFSDAEMIGGDNYSLEAALSFAPVAKILLPHALKDQLWENGLCLSVLGLLGAKFAGIIQLLDDDDRPEDHPAEDQPVEFDPEKFDLKSWLVDVADLPAEDAALFVQFATLKCSPELQSWVLDED